MKYKHAGFWVRFLATIIDSIILMIPLGIIIGIVANADPIMAYRINQLSNIFIIILVIFLWLKWGGRTPGKKIMGIKILKKDYTELDFKAAILRYIGYFFSTILFCIGYIMVGVREDKKGLHDLIGGTVVVFENPEKVSYQQEIKEEFPEKK
jgi:uncharacterized RDD family membrane protein YckC